MLRKAAMSIEDRFFACTFPCGIAYADKGREEAGDYQKVAFLSFSDLTFKPAPGANRELLEMARRDAAIIQGRKGEEFQVSTSGQTVILGYALLKD